MLLNSTRPSSGKRLKELTSIEVAEPVYQRNFTPDPQTWHGSRSHDAIACSMEACDPEKFGPTMRIFRPPVPADADVPPHWSSRPLRSASVKATLRASLSIPQVGLSGTSRTAS